ncbi:MAG: phage tail protein [Eubacterium sp.]|nr:phage tail protein [Eubacterium sp.]
MAVIGTLGDVVFSASSRAVRTISGLKYDSSASYTQHARHLKTPLAEFTGLSADSISFSVLLSVYLY